MKYALWLANVEGMTNVRIQHLLEQAENAKTVYEMDEPALQAAGLDQERIEKIILSKKEWDLEARFFSLYERGISFVSMEQPGYPHKLLNIHNAPYLLYYRGNLPDAKQKSVAVVGARGRSEYGRQLAFEIAKRLAGTGVCVISGLARGIDADGHRGALEGKGKTFAVLGNGVDICYPGSNQYIYDRILDTEGGIISEYAPGQQPRPAFFPQRNRIISGLSDYVVLVEAKKKSGSLITADYALEQGKEIYAVPGRITDPLSLGCNQLISQGAGILYDMDEFVKQVLQKEDFLCSQINFRKNLLEKDEGMVYSLLDFRPTGLGTLVEKSGLSLGALLEVIGSLEQKEFIKETVPNYYVRNI